MQIERVNIDIAITKLYHEMPVYAFRNVCKLCTIYLYFHFQYNVRLLLVHLLCLRSQLCGTELALIIAFTLQVAN